MTWPTLPPGLDALLTDAREFAAAVRFGRPEAFALLVVLPLLALVDWYAARRRRADADAIGRPAAVAGLLTHPRPRRRWLGLTYPLAWALLAAGLAGPQWGTGEAGVAVGRDVVVVVDLSRSMLAGDLADGRLARWEAARDALKDLLDALARRGGHRVAVVVFAARPVLLLPLTTDYDHARATADELDGRFPPHETRPGADPDIPSGTRIGAALQAAVAAHDPRFPGYQDIILLSDGDDPADDREWAKGADAARRADIPVHTVGVGNPNADAFIPLDEGFLELGPGVEVTTRLREGVLRQVAAETRGAYLPAGRDPARLGDFFAARVEPFPSRQLDDDAQPQPKDRAVWCLVPALGLFAVGWLRGR